MKFKDIFDNSNAGMYFTNRGMNYAEHGAIRLYANAPTLGDRKLMHNGSVISHIEHWEDNSYFSVVYEDDSFCGLPIDEEFKVEFALITVQYLGELTS